jgi:GTP-binding protein Era
LKNLYIIAGCNGAGKTTASYTILPEILDCHEFVNADEIARGLSPFNPNGMAIEAGKLMLKRIKELLPESPAFFDKDQLTDKPARFFVSEIIREKILLYYDKEVPYSVEVVVERFKEDDRQIHINAVIYVERDSQKGIIIGHQGTALKKVSTEARKTLEKFFDKHIYLEIFVKVDKDWRSSKKELDNFGYNPDYA